MSIATTKFSAVLWGFAQLMKHAARRHATFRDRLRERNLVSQEDNRYQYRFRDIVDLDDGRNLFTVEHEVRSITHPMYLRPLFNRNPMLTNRNYAPGHDQLPWAIGPEHYA